MFTNLEQWAEIRRWVPTGEIKNAKPAGIMNFTGRRSTSSILFLSRRSAVQVFRGPSPG